MSLQPRNDYVVCRIVKHNLSLGGVALPDTSAESKKFYVVAKGPKVGDDIQIGNRVAIVASKDEGDYFPLPPDQDKDLFLVQEKWVALVIGE